MRLAPRPGMEIKPGDLKRRQRKKKAGSKFQPPLSQQQGGSKCRDIRAQGGPCKSQLEVGPPHLSLHGHTGEINTRVNSIDFAAIYRGAPCQSIDKYRLGAHFAWPQDP